jgi:hypothetical protein
MQFVTLLSSNLATTVLLLSLLSSIAISLSGFWAQQRMSPTTYIVFINSCKIPAVAISMMTGQDGCISCQPLRIFGVLLWALGSCRFLFLSMKSSDQRLPASATHELSDFSSTFLSRFRLSKSLLYLSLLLIVIAAAGQFQIINTMDSRNMTPVSSRASSLMRLYASTAGPDPRILSGLPIGRHSSDLSSCSAVIFDHSDVTHSLFDAAVNYSPGFQFVLGLPQATISSWRQCSMEALRNAREYYSKLGGGVLPANVSSHPSDVCPALHMAVAPVVAAAIQSMTRIVRFFGFDAGIKQQHCYESNGRPVVNPFEKLKEWRSFLKNRVDTRKGVPQQYASSKRGYVFAGSTTQHLLMARSIVDVLRSYGSALPAEFWVDRVEVDSPRVSQEECHHAFTRSGLRCRFMCEISDVQLYFPLCHPDGLTPYQSKLIAMKYSSFEQVFFLDNDVVPLKSLDFMFSTPEFIHRGAIFWADALPAQPAFPFGLEVAQSIGVQISHPVPEQYKSYVSPLCSAQIMVDKSRFWRELSLATYLNLDTTLYYRVMHGDKDIFAAAWLVTTFFTCFITLSFLLHTSFSCIHLKQAIHAKGSAQFV